MPKSDPNRLPVIRAKLHAPRTPSDLVRRDRLLELLSGRPDRPFTLVSAPAGYGKSTLVAYWLKTADVAGTWYSVEESDDNLRQFLTCLIAAVRNHSRNACSTTLELLRAQELPSLAIVREQFANDLEAIRKPFILVVDDFHRIRRPEVHEILDHLLEFPPRSLHLAIVTRHDPPLRLTRLRAGGRMVDVRERDLRFTEEETRAVLRRLAGIDIADDVLAHIHAELEGWIVGLRLVCLALRNHDDPEGFLRGLSGGTQSMQEYLTGEVLSQQPDTFRRCLLSLAILDRFCAPLCEAVCGEELGSGTNGGTRFLSQLREANLFTIELDNQGEWFRFHHLFRRLLLNQLESHAGPGYMAALHLRASIWFGSKDQVDEALKHAAAADDMERVAFLLERYRAEALKTDRRYVLEKWLAVLPEDVLLQHPELLLVRAWMFVHQFRYPMVLPLLDQVDTLISASGTYQHLSGEVNLLRGMTHTRLGDSKLGLKFLKRALSHIPVTSLEARAQAEVMFALASQMEGNKEQAIRFLDEIMNKSPSPQGLRSSRLHQIYVYLHIVSGHLTQAERSNKFTGGPTEDDNVYGEAWREYLQGLIHLERYELDSALESLECFRGTTARRYIQYRRAAIDSMTCLMLTYQLQGRTQDAEDALQLVREFVSEMDDPDLLVFVHSAVARIAALGDSPESAIRWANTAEVSFDPTMLWFLDSPSITACRVRLAEGSAAGLKRTEEELRALVKLNEAQHNCNKLTELLCLLAVACSQQGKTDTAREYLDRALTLAGPGGMVLPFVEWSPSLAKMMLELVPQNTDWLTKRIRQILRGQPAADRSAQPAVDALTPRERDVLELLAQRLYDKEIAEQLGISAETVKTHVKRIRGKLNVSSRRQAVTKARERGLIQDHGSRA